MFAGGDSHKMIWVMAKLRLRDNNIVKSVLCVQLSLRKKQNMLKQVSSSATFHGETRFVSVESPSQDGEITRISFWDSFFFSVEIWATTIMVTSTLKQWNSMKFHEILSSTFHWTRRDAQALLGLWARPRIHRARRWLWFPSPLYGSTWFHHMVSVVFKIKVMGLVSTIKLMFWTLLENVDFHQFSVPKRSGLDTIGYMYLDDMYVSLIAPTEFIYPILFENTDSGFV